MHCTDVSIAAVVATTPTAAQISAYNQAALVAPPDGPSNTSYMQMSPQAAAGPLSLQTLSAPLQQGSGWQACSSPVQYKVSCLHAKQVQGDGLEAIDIFSKACFS